MLSIVRAKYAGVPACFETLNGPLLYHRNITCKHKCKVHMKYGFLNTGFSFKSDEVGSRGSFFTAEAFACVYIRKLCLNYLTSESPFL